MITFLYNMLLFPGCNGYLRRSWENKKTSVSEQYDTEDFSVDWYLVSVYYILQPDAFFDQYQADSDFDAFCQQHKRITPGYGDGRKFAQAIGEGDADGPEKNAVEQKSDNGFTTGTQGEIQGVE